MGEKTSETMVAVPLAALRDWIKMAKDGQDPKVTFDLGSPHNMLVDAYEVRGNLLKAIQHSIVGITGI